jgi:GTP cyclohydrolase I
MSTGALLTTLESKTFSFFLRDRGLIPAFFWTPDYDMTFKSFSHQLLSKATHHCMTTRGVNKPGTDLVTSRMLGCFRDSPLTRQELLSLID